MTIPKDLKKRLETYAPRIGKTVEDLASEYEDFVPKAQEKYPDLSGNKLAKKAFDLMINSYRRQYGSVRSSATLYEGWFDGITNLRNLVTEKINRIARQVKTDGREQAMINGLIDENGTPIDDRPTIFGRRKNPNFGKALHKADPAYIRTAYGICRKKGTDEWFTFQLTAFEKLAELLEVKTFTPCEFRAREGKTRGELFATNVTQFFPIEADWDLEDIYDDFVIPCSDIEARMRSRDWDSKDIRVKAYVVSMRAEPVTDAGDKIMTVADGSLDLNTTISCFIPSHVPTNFGNDSHLVINARVRSYRNAPSLNIYGIYPIPGEITSTSVDMMDEDDISFGWVDDPYNPTIPAGIIEDEDEEEEEDEDTFILNDDEELEL